MSLYRTSADSIAREAMSPMKRVLSMGDVAYMQNDGDDSGGTFTQPRRRGKRSKKGSTIADNLSNSVIDAPTQSTQLTQCTTVETPPPVGQSDLYKRVEELLSTVRSQQEAINTLPAKLNFMLSFLGIADDECKETAGAVKTAELPINPSESQSQTVQTSPVPVRVATYASTVGAHALQGTRSGAPVYRQLSNFRDVVAAAVSAEQRSRERRAKSLIVSGLAPSADTTDKVHFKRLCMMELGIEPSVVFTRRLGNDASRVRPLLVSLPTEKDVLAIMNNAKMLRRSDSARSVYINRNLSKEEARLAYEARYRRRERQQQSQDRRRQYESPKASLSAGATEFVSTIAAAAMPVAAAAVVPGGASDDDTLSGRHR